MLVYVLALGAAFTNALSSVLQRRAAGPAGSEDRRGTALLEFLLHRPVYFASILALMGSFGLQAAALSQGSLAEVQPTLATELLFALGILLVRYKRPVGWREWASAVAVVAGLVSFLVSAQPTAGATRASSTGWSITGGAVAAVLAGSVLFAHRSEGRTQAAALAMASSVTYALTAAIITSFTASLATHGLTTFAGWTPYALGVCGGAATWLANNAFERGTVAVVQPILTIVDPLVSIGIGIGLFGVRLRGGPLIAGEVAGLAVLAAGVIGLTTSPVATANEALGEAVKA